MRRGRRVAFWAAVAGVSVLANIGVHAVATKRPNGAVDQLLKSVGS
jgi:hypothetical protein